MMHHPNMHHQPMTGPPPPRHMAGHQAMPAHHQMPHQMHRENRHVTLTRVPLGPSQPGGGMGGHGALGGMGAAMGVPPPHHAPAQRPPHAIRPMHHPPAQHHNVPPPARQMRRPYSVGGGYGPASAPAVMPPPYAQPPPAQPLPTTQPAHRRLCIPITSTSTVQSKLKTKYAVTTTPNAVNVTSKVSSTPHIEKVAEETKADVVPSGATVSVSVTSVLSADEEGSSSAASGDGEAARPLPAPANSKEKTPMCLVNELARYNKIKHQYRLTSEMGPAHKKVFTVTLRLGDTEEYTAEGSSIKRAQHAAAGSALGGTRYPPPPPRAAPPHAPHAHRHATAVMPTVELNALAMKLCQPAVYTSVPPIAAPRRPRAPPYRVHAPLLPHYPPHAPHSPHAPHPPHGPHPPHPPHVPHPRMLEPGPSLLYRVRVCVGGRSWVGEGGTPQAARHDAAARALLELRPPPDPPAPQPQPRPHPPDTGDGSTELLNLEVKSPVSLVHELALKRNLSVQFSVKSERGPPHMRVFVTSCSVGELATEGEGNGKKVSKRRAAERMLEEMRRRWPPALLRARAAPDRRRAHQPKKKPRNLIKEGGAGSPAPGAGGGTGTGGGAGAGGAADNPISRLAVARHAARARSPQYRVLEERGAARRREFLVQCDAPPHSATGLGPNKKTAKRRAAHNVLLAMELTNGTENGSANGSGDSSTSTNADASKPNGDIKRKENETGGANDIRQPVPGVLMMDYQRSGQPTQPNGVSETSATGGTGGNTPGAKDQLMYLSQLLGFTVQFSDFPKRNHGEYLSLVSLSTEPPVMCHGGGASTAHSHEQCARAALRALALMGLDAAASGVGTDSPPAPDAVANGVAE